MPDAVVITCSTRAASGVYPDTSGQLLASALREWGFAVAEPVVVADGAPAGSDQVVARTDDTLTFRLPRAQARRWMLVTVARGEAPLLIGNPVYLR